MSKTITLGVRKYTITLSIRKYSIILSSANAAEVYIPFMKIGSTFIIR